MERAGSLFEEGLGWKSVVSTNADLNEAVDEIIASVSINNESNMSKYNLAIFFTSSIYEASAFKYDELFETLSKKMPGMKTMIGCTTGEPLHMHRAGIANHVDHSEYSVKPWKDASCIVMLVAESLWKYFIAEHASDRASELIVITRAVFNN